MSIMPSLGTATSGINAFQNGLTVVSDNIANTDTIAFKENDILFSEMISQFSHLGHPNLHTGNGAQADIVRAPFKQGAFEQTGNNLDLTIEGAGFFQLKSPQDSPITFYSRAGAFNVDKDGFIVNVDGLQLQGAKVTLGADGKPIAGANTAEAINITTIFSPPKATTTVNASVNLFAGDPDPLTFVNGVAPSDPQDIEAGNLFMNGVDLGDIPAGVEALIEAINGAEILTGVHADEENIDFLKLTNANGGPIVVSFANSAIASQTGLSNGNFQGHGGKILTGTVTAADDPVTGATNFVRGAGTRFKTELRPGDRIVLGNESYTVKSIASDTELTTIEEVTPELQAETVKGSVRNATFSTPVTVFDSTGAAHTVNLRFVKLAPFLDTGEDPLTGEEVTTVKSQWGWSAVVGKDDNVIIPPALVAFEEVQANGIMTFTSDGLLDQENLPIPNPTLTGFNFKAPLTSIALPAPNQQIEFNFNGLQLDGSDATTQFGSSPSTIVNQSQNGHSEGVVMANTLSVDGRGIISGLFTNGTSLELAQLLLTTFPDEDGLHRVGGNSYIETTASGAPLVAGALTGGRGKIRAGGIESSTVDLTKQFVKLITYQRGFQANSRVITTTDEMIQEIVNLKR
jgi:flagellar hook protein FlgE